MRTIGILAALALVGLVGCATVPTPAPSLTTSPTPSHLSLPASLACPPPFDPAAPTPDGGCGPLQHAALAAVASLGYPVWTIRLNPCDPSIGGYAACLYLAGQPDAWVSFTGTDRVAELLMTRTENGGWVASVRAFRAPSPEPSA